MNKLEKIVDKLHNIEKEISNIISASEELCSQYSKEFKQQGNLFSLLNEKISDALHEIGSHVGFLENDISLLINYIEFRKKFDNYTSEELLILIDSENISSAYKIKIAKNKKLTQSELLKQLKILKKDWNKIFNNIGYKKLI